MMRHQIALTFNIILFLSNWFFKYLKLLKDQCDVAHIFGEPKWVLFLVFHTI